MESPDHLGLSGDSYNQVELELRNKSGANQALLYYITDADTQWDATKSVAIPIGTNDSFNRRYALELPTLPDETFRVAIFCRLRRTRSALPNGLINSRRNRLEG